MRTQTIGTNGLVLTKSSIDAAMRFLYDLGERVQYPFVLVGETAHQLVENPDSFFQLDVDRIECMIPKRQHTPEVQSTLEIVGFRRNEKGWEYSWEGVPIQIYVVTRRYKFFENLDTRYYKVDEFKIANPFAKYWKARFIVR